MKTIGTLFIVAFLMLSVTAVSGAAIDQGRVVRVGAFNFYPGIFKDTDGEIKGFYVDALHDIAQRENIVFEYVYGSWSEGLDRLKAGEVDLITSAAYTPERAEYMDFAKTPLLTVWGELYVPLGSEIDGIRQVKNKKIGVMKDDINGRHFVDLVKKFHINCEFVEFPGFKAVFEAVAAGKVDGGVVNCTFGIAKQREYNLRSTGVVFNPFDIYFAVSKGENGELLALLDRYLAEWRREQNSVYNKARLKWSRGTGSEITVIPRWLSNSFIALLFLTIVSGVFILLLRRQVRRATAEVVQREASLLQSERRFSEVSDQAQEFIWEVNAQGLYTYASKGCHVITGYTQSEIIGKMHFYDLYPEHGRDAFRASTFKLFERQDCFRNLLKPILNKDGTVHWVNTNGLPILGSDGTLLGYRGCDADVTTQKHLEEELRHQVSLFQDLLETSQDMIWRCDAEGRFIYINTAWEDITGYTVEEMLGKRLADFQPTEIGQRDFTEFARLLSAGKVKGYETVFTDKTGGTLYLLFNAILLRDGSGGFIGTSGTAYDITERRQTEQKRLEMEQKFQQTQKLESLGVLAGGIAHDFNNILTVILGHCFIAKSSKLVDQSCKTFFDQIEIAGNRAAELCRQMLAYAGRKQLEQTQVNLGQLVEENAIMLRSAFNKNVSIELDLATNLPDIKGDSAQIQQIVMNLIINAAEAIGDVKGSIDVSLSRTVLQADKFETDCFGNPIRSGGYLCLKVSDNGCGMDEETKKRVFEPFFTTKFTGRGLGLSAILGIIKSHEGALQLESKPGEGTTFSVFFPLMDSGEVNERQNTEDKGAEFKGSGTILLVDDEESIRIIGAALLNAMGYSTVLATNGREALELFRNGNSKIDLIMLDLIMPEMGGVETYYELRKIVPKLPIVICSGYGASSLPADIEIDGELITIQKPFKPDTLREVMNKMIHGMSDC